MDLKPLFEPRSIAIVGASNDTRRQGGGLVVKFLQQHGYAGSIYPVNPKYTKVAGLKCYPSLEAVPHPIDLAVLAVPAKAVQGVLAAVPKGHLNIALVLTSGFGELGPDGKKLEQAMITTARTKGIRIVGPNVVGSVNLWNGVVPTISQYFDREKIKPGEIALVSQSGAFGTAILAQAEQAGVRFGYFVSSGNESDLEFSDYGRYLLDQDNVRVVGGNLEGIRNGSGFVDFARRAMEKGKPVVVLKLGSSEAGAAAAKSHTGALVGSDAVAQAVFDTYNVLRATDGENLLDLLKIFGKTPIAEGKRLAILSHSGGAGVMAADAAESAGAVLNPLPEDLRDLLTEMLPSFASINNPLDMTGGVSLQGKLMADCLRTMLEHEAYDAALLCVNLIWREGTILMRELDDIASTIAKPFAVSWVAPNKETADALIEAPYPVFGDPARAARALTQRLLFDERRRALALSPTVKRVRPPEPEGDLPLTDVNNHAKVLRAYGIRLPSQTLATSLKGAEAFRAQLDGLVALKIASPDIAHRTDIGGIVTDIKDAKTLAAAYDRILKNAKQHLPDARIDGVLVQEMVRGRTEAFIGVKRDPVFGPMIAFGAGGTLVELVRQIKLRPAPVSQAQAQEMVEMSVLYPLLVGYRGGTKLDVTSLVDTVTQVSWLAAHHAELQELDLNPVVVLPEGGGCVAVDYKLTVSAGA